MGGAGRARFTSWHPSGRAEAMQRPRERSGPGSRERRGGCGWSVDRLPGRLHPLTQMQRPPRSLHTSTAPLGAGSDGTGAARPSHLGSRCAVLGGLTLWPMEGGTVIVLGTGAGPGAPSTTPCLGGARPLPASASLGTVPVFLPQPAGHRGQWRPQSLGRTGRSGLLVVLSPFLHSSGFPLCPRLSWGGHAGWWGAGPG